VRDGEADRKGRALTEFRLPPGRHGIPPAAVAENQRWRLLGAAAEVLAEGGHVRTTSTRVSKVAGVSPATFYQHFDNVGDCLLAAYEAGVECVSEIVSEACGAEQLGWPERLGVAVASTLRFLAVEPALAFLLGDEAPAGEVAIAAVRRKAIDRLAKLLAAGRSLRSAEAAELPAATERHLVSGAVAIYAERVAAGDVERLPELGPQLTEMLAAPYVDRAMAAGS
jgi:AcrR family transcriptional regulator